MSTSFRIVAVRLVRICVGRCECFQIRVMAAGVSTRERWSPHLSIMTDKR